MKKRVSMTVWAALLVVSLVLSTLGANAQRTGGRALGSARQACNLEGLWAQVTFNAKVANAKLLEMRPDFQRAWDARAEVSSGITTRAAMLPGIEKMDELFHELMAEVKKKLTEEQFDSLSSWLEEQESILEMTKQMARLAAKVKSRRREPQE